MARTAPASRRAGCSRRWPSAVSRSCRGCRRSCTSARTREHRGARRCCRASRSARRCATSRAVTSRRDGCSSFRCSRCSSSGCSGRVTTTGTCASTSARIPRCSGRRSSAAPRSSSRCRSTTRPAARSRRGTARSCFPFFVLLVARGVDDAPRPACPRRVAHGRRAARVRRCRPQRRDAAHAGRAGRARCCVAKRSPVTTSSTAPTRSGPRSTGSCERRRPRRGHLSRRSAIPRQSTGSTTRRGSRAPTRVAFAAEALHRAGDHTIWFVSAPGYTTHVGICETISAELAKTRRWCPASNPDDKIFEIPGLQQFPPDPIT